MAKTIPFRIVAPACMIVFKKKITVVILHLVRTINVISFSKMGDAMKTRIVQTGFYVIKSVVHVYYQLYRKLFEYNF